MGYSSRLRGRIEIDPPLTWSEVLDTGYDPERAEQDDRLIMIEVETETHDVEEGVLTLKRGVAIVPVTDEDLRAYSFEADVKGLIEHPVFRSHKLSGGIIRIGEDQGDVERITSLGRSERAELRWPDGTLVEGF
jgi:hypothetical protein